MAVREIRLFGDPVLKTVSDPVVSFDEKIAALVQDLIETTKIPGRAGVAAPQIGVNLRAFSYNVEGKVGCIINPVIVELKGETIPVDEGCLSVPGLWHKTPRREFARVQGVDETGAPVELSGSGLMAQMLQHECDHLDGFLYLDRLEPEARKTAMRELRQTDWFLKN
ncbi:MAG: peptide deformylase [Micrococcales bacterium]